MTYAPPPSYSASATAMTDPTNVLGRRFAAWFLDLFLPSVAAFVVGAVVWFGSAREMTKPIPGEDYCTVLRQESNLSCFEVNDTVWVASNSDTGRALGVSGLIFLLIPINCFLLQGITGASLGKHLTGLRVVEGQGDQVGFGRNALRTLLLPVDGFCGWLVGGITVLATHPHRRVGDLVAGTFVVGKASVGTPVVVAPTGAAAPGQHPLPAPAWTPPPAAPFPATPAPVPNPAQNPAQPSVANPAPPSVPAWGVAPPTAAAPAVETPAVDAAAPTDAAPTPSTDDATQAGWAAPSLPTPDPNAASAPAPGPVPPAAPAADPTQPQWDAARQAYIAWEPQSRRWMQHDPVTNQWRPI